MYTLTDEQSAMLLDFITTLHGDDLGYLEFTHQMLFLFEDIPGFETIPLSVANDIINTLWSNYRDQSQGTSIH